MAKRLTDTDKWKKPFLKALPAEYKIFYLYILDDCDHAGIWHVDSEVAELRLGIKLSLVKARGLFGERVVEFDNGTKWFIPDFITFQYGVFDEKNKMYKPVTAILDKYNLMGHLSSIYGGKVKEKDMVMVTDNTGKSLSNPARDDVEFTIEHCMTVALLDKRWVEANKTDESELLVFNSELVKTGTYQKNPMDYKSHFARWKPKNQELLNRKPKQANDPTNAW